MWVWAALTHTRCNVVCNGGKIQVTKLALWLHVWARGTVCSITCDHPEGLKAGESQHPWLVWYGSFIQLENGIKKKSRKIHQAVHMICCSAAIKFLSQANLLLNQWEIQRVSLNPWNKFEQVTLSCGWRTTVTKARKGEQNNMFTLWSLRPPL